MTEDMRPLAEGGWDSREFAGIRCGRCGALVARAHVLADGQFYVATDGHTPALSPTTPPAAVGCTHASDVTPDELRTALARFRRSGKRVRLIGR